MLAYPEYVIHGYEPTPHGVAKASDAVAADMHPVRVQ